MEFIALTLYTNFAFMMHSRKINTFVESGNEISLIRKRNRFRYVKKN